MIRAYFFCARVQSAIRKRGARVTKTINAYALKMDNPIPLKSREKIRVKKLNR